MMQALRFAVYFRKSTDSEDRQKASIPAQRKEVMDYAKSRGLSVVREFGESRSAKRPGREQFGAMFEAIHAGEVNGILCWHPDRLARNALDGGAVIYALSEGTLKAIVTPSTTFEGKADDKFMLNLNFGLSERYIDELSKNVKRGNRQALREGRWPGRPPVGYQRNLKTGAIEPDPERFDVVHELWKLRLSGAPISELRARAADRGLTMPRYGAHGGKTPSISQLHRMLESPFYTGLMRFGNEEHPGSHPPMITWSQFEQVRATARTGKGREPRPQRDLGFLYQGLITCGTCGARVTVERTRNRFGATYIHYHCARKKRRLGVFCPERSVREEMLTAGLARAIENIRIPEPVIELVAEKLESADDDERERREQERTTLGRRLGQIQAQDERLVTMCTDGAISNEELRERRRELAGRRRQTEEALNRIDEGVSLLEPFESIVSGLRVANLCFVEADRENKRQIVRTLFSNLELKDRTLLSRPKKVLSLLSNPPSDSSVLGWFEEVRSELSTLS